MYENEVAAEAYEEYQEIEINTQEELIEEVKRLRREVWELKHNNQGAIDNEKAYELIDEIKGLKEENENHHSRKSMFFRTAYVFSILNFAFAIIGVIVGIVWYTAGGVYYFNDTSDYVEVLIPFVSGILALIGVSIFFSVRKKKLKSASIQLAISGIISVIEIILAIVMITNYSIYSYDWSLVVTMLADPYGGQTQLFVFLTILVFQALLFFFIYKAEKTSD